MGGLEGKESRSGVIILNSPKNNKKCNFSHELFMQEFLFVFQNRVFLCSLSCPRISSVEQGGFELTEIHLMQEFL